MKKIFLAIAAIASFAFVGCEDKLDIDQKGVVSMENFYQTDADAESALTTAYYMAGRFLSNTMNTTAGWNDCPLLSMWEYASDDMFVAGSDKTDGQSGNEIQTFRHDMNNSLIQGTYEAYYMIINAANLVICNFQDRTDITPTMQRCVAEARVIRAQVQLLLALAWGTAPIVDHILAVSDKPANEESQEKVLQWIADECDLAIPSLGSKANVNDAAKSIVVTKEYAYALKGKALISKHDYAGAKEALAKCVNSGLYELVPSNKMESLNHYSGRASTEAVFELNYLFDAGNSGNYYRTQPNFRSLWHWRTSHLASVPTGIFTNGWGWCNPSKKFVDAILAYDGENSARRKAWIKSYDEVLYEMEYAADATVADKTTDKGRGINQGQGLYGHCGWFMWKRDFRGEDMVTDGNVANWNLTVMRYAEVLLLYAEACANAGDNDGSGLAALKAVNVRAQAQTPVTALTMDAVKKEKFLECWLDGTRFQDLVRWGDAATELANSGTYYPNFCDAINDGEAQHRGYINESDADWCVKAYPGKVGFVKGKNELFPFPFCEINVNPNIAQNAGY